MRIAVIGAGVSGAVCASSLAEKGIAVTVFESARGPGGRMSQRRERTEDGKELCFDHGAPCFTVKDPGVRDLVHKWEAAGLVAEWKGPFSTFDAASGQFISQLEDSTKRYVGVPGMNSICKAICSRPGVEAKFGVTVAKVEWSREGGIWDLRGLQGESIGHYDAVVASDKNMASSRFTAQTGLPPPLGTHIFTVSILSSHCGLGSCKFSIISLLFREFCFVCTHTRSSGAGVTFGGAAVL